MATGRKKITLTPEELSAPITSRNFFRRARHYIDHKSQSDELPVATPGEKCWDLWREYFERHLCWQPWILLEIINGKRKEMTVPCEEPEHFDKTFIDQIGWKPKIPVKKYHGQEWLDRQSAEGRRQDQEWAEKRKTRPTWEELKTRIERIRSGELPVSFRGGAATCSELYARFGITRIPGAFDAVDVTRMAARHGTGAALQAALDRNASSASDLGGWKRVGTAAKPVFRPIEAIQADSAEFAASPALSRLLTEQKQTSDDFWDDPLAQEENASHE